MSGATLDVGSTGAGTAGAPSVADGKNVQASQGTDWSAVGTTIGATIVDIGEEMGWLKGNTPPPEPPPPPKEKDDPMAIAVFLGGVGLACVALWWVLRKL